MKDDNDTSGISRRSFIKAAATIAATAVARPAATATGSSPKMKIAVIGAGAFGGWSALQLLRKGKQVTLIDSWGPGNSRASSGGETRVIRAVYGAAPLYVKWSARSLKLWRENQERWKRKVFFPIGTMWMVQENDSYETPSLPLMDAEGLRYEKWTPAEAAKKYPQINFDGVHWVLHETDAGYLLARQSCQLVMQSFIQEGGEFRIGQVQPGAISSGAMSSLVLQDGSRVDADLYIFACGPWLGSMFPDLAPKWIQPTRQEVYFFGLPPGDSRFTDAQLPVWIDHGARLIYGIPGNEYRGFKVGDDTRGPSMDPTNDTRLPTEECIRISRSQMEFRFPGMKGAPLVESRVCQYENSPDSNFVIDTHPEAKNVWIVGGGSGHGFKHGPALGEHVASLICDHAERDPMFSIQRLLETK